jgi:hypothetical protein
VQVTALLIEMNTDRHGLKHRLTLIFFLPQSGTEIKRIAENQVIRGQGIRRTGYQEKADAGNFGVVKEAIFFGGGNGCG